MDEFRIECYISDGTQEDTRLSNLNKQDLLKWKKDIETIALSKYYNKKIKLSSNKN